MTLLVGGLPGRGRHDRRDRYGHEDAAHGHGGASLFACTAPVHVHLLLIIIMPGI